MSSNKILYLFLTSLSFRPVVAFQTNSFLRARPKSSTFVSKLAQTQVTSLAQYFSIDHESYCQAVEFYAEWTLMPSNVSYQVSTMWKK